MHTTIECEHFPGKNVADIFRKRVVLEGCQNDEDRQRQVMNELEQLKVL